jgi:hypothetical protein
VAAFRMIKTTECPFCHQKVLDFSNDPRFVNHNPPKEGNFTEKERSKDKKNKKEARRNE